MNIIVTVKDGYSVEDVASTLTKAGVTVIDTLLNIGIISAEIESPMTLEEVQKYVGVHSAEKEVFAKTCTDKKPIRWPTPQEQGFTFPQNPI